jgi:hypothetical protein
MVLREGVWPNDAFCAPTPLPWGALRESGQKASDLKRDETPQRPRSKLAALMTSAAPHDSRELWQAIEMVGSWCLNRD